MEKDLASAAPAAAWTEGRAMDYARACALALGVPMDEARIHRVAGYLVLTSHFAARLDAVPLGPEVEPAEVFCPAPFPRDEGPA